MIISASHVMRKGIAAWATLMKSPEPSTRCSSQRTAVPRTKATTRRTVGMSMRPNTSSRDINLRNENLLEMILTSHIMLKEAWRRTNSRVAP
jgi:hypothetical protein